MGQLAAGVAHELNNPLGTIILYSHLIQKEVNKIEQDGSSRTGEDLGMILREAQRCKEIVSGLLNFARQGRLRLRDFDLNELIRDCLKKIQKEEIQFVCNLHSITRKVFLDPDQIYQLIQNVIQNSMDAVENQDKPEIRISTIPTDGGFNLIIEDNGCGISEENLKKMWNPFFSSKPVGKGTGLGLAIVYGILKMHSGRVNVKSNTESGTQIEFFFPVKLQEKVGNGLIADSARKFSRF